MICVDPGLRGCGVAHFSSYGELQWASYVKNPMKTGRGPRAHFEMASEVHSVLRHLNLYSQMTELILEFPVVYPGVSRVDLNDLLDLAGVDGAIAMNWYDSLYVHHVTPRDWKGQVPKAIMNRRVLAALTELERGRIESKGAKDHNTLDAIGIGLHRLARL